MIIVGNKDIENMVYFPKNIYTGGNGVYGIELRDRGSNITYSFNGVTDNMLVPFGFYTFKLNFRSVPSGEYEYRIYNGLTVLGTGLIRLVGLSGEPRCYEEKRTYVTYDGK